ncbi:hypothetical protein VTK56DRAFT_2216 [Thermocarpiscus australiensis]
MTRLNHGRLQEELWSLLKTHPDEHIHLHHRLTRHTADDDTALAPTQIRPPLSSGSRPALTNLFFIATLLHHISSALLPWLGPVRMAHAARQPCTWRWRGRTSFLDGVLSYSWGVLLVEVPEEVEVNDGGRLRLGIWWGCLPAAEYAITRSVNYGCMDRGVLIYKLLAGREAEHIALGNVLKARCIKILLTVWRIVYFVRNRFWPLLGLPGLFMAIFAVAKVVTALVRYRSTFYIALEISGSLAFGGIMVLSLVLLGAEFYDDPLGLNLSTRPARAGACQARSVLPQGAALRTRILRRKVALPLTRPPPQPTSQTMETQGRRLRKRAKVAVQ